MKVENKGKKILAIDDIDDNLIVLKALLAEAFPLIKFVSASSGQKGLALCRSEMPDVVLLDIVMPGMDGYEVCRALKADDLLKNIPVVMITAAKTDLNSKIYALECGADALLTKPVNLSELSAQIRSVLRVKAVVDHKQNEKQGLEELVDRRTAALEKELERRKKTEHDLEKSVSLLTATLDSTADGILVVDKNGNIINYNNKFIEFWGIPESVLATCNDEKLISFVIDQLKDPDGFLKKVRELYLNEEESSYDILEFIDGRIFERYSQSQKLEGKSVGRVWSFRDITGRMHAEELLTKTRKEFQNYFQNCAVGMSVTSPQKSWLEVNQSLCRMLGYSKEELAGMTWSDLTYPEDIKRNLDLFSEVAAGKTDQYELDKRFVRKDGSLLYVALSVVCERNPDGSIHHLLASYIDITERKLMEEALNASEELYRNLVLKMPDGVYTSTHEGKFVSVNPAFADMLGYLSCEELMAIDIKKELYFEPEDRTRLVSESNEDEFDVYKLKKKDQSEIWVEDHSWFNSDENGNILFHKGIIRDVTDRKRAEDQLRSLSRAVDQNPASIVITDTVGQIEYVNPKFSELTGYSPEEVLGKNPRILKSGTTSPAEYAELWKIILAGGEWQGEFKNRKKNGDEYIENALISPIKDENGEITHFLAVKEDITDRRHTEDALRKSEEKISIHIQRTPIAVIEYDIEFCFTRWNPAAEHIFGYAADEIIGQHMNIIIPENVGSHVVDLMQRIAEEGVAIQSTNENITKNGELITCEWYNSPLVAADGTVTGMAAFAIDITERKRAEVELRSSQSMLRGIVDNFPGVVFWKDINSVYLGSNKAFSEGAGLTDTSEVIGKNDYEMPWGKTEADIYRSIDRRIIESAKPEIGIIETQLQSNGRVVWLDTSKIPLLDNEGHVIGILGVSHDITNIKHAEESLLESNELNKSLLQSIPFGMDIVDENGNILFQSENLEKLFGRKAIGQKCWNLYCDNQTQCVECPLNSGINIGKTELSEMSDFFGGKSFQISHTGMLFKGKKAILEIFQDITGRKKDEILIRKLSKAIGQSPVSTIITDAKGKIEFVNTAFTTLTQYTLEEVINKPPRIFNHGHAPEADYDMIWENLWEGKIWKGEFLNRRKDGTVYWEDVTISSLMNGAGEISNYILIMDDISEKKRMFNDLIVAKEKAEESNRLKSAFLATMNHELRTPLNHILGFSELIMSGVAAEDNVNFASSIQSSGQSLLSIIEGIFDLALVEQSNIKLRNQTFSLMDHFMENKASFDNILRTSTKHEQIHLVFKPDTRWLSSYVTADRSKINQVLTNLFKNAVKFTQKGTIEFGYKIENEHSLLFYVKDTGIGIPVEKQNIIFDFFRQGDDSSTRVYGGIGIGLAISQKIAQILKGELKVISEPGTGSTFSLTIPAELSEKQGV